MYINGTRFNAFANLAHALRQIIRGREKAELQECPQLIWADQMCINQSNTSERSHQVNFMRNIYECADVVPSLLRERSEQRSMGRSRKTYEFRANIFLRNSFGRQDASHRGSRLRGL